MKRIITFLFIALIAAGSVFAQNAKSIKDLNGTPSRDVVDLTCPPGSLYSQLPDGLNAWCGNFGYYFNDNVLVAPGSPVTSITFWMVEQVPFNPLSMDIHFFQDASGYPGAVIASYTGLLVPGIPTGESAFSYPVLAYTYVLPSPITLAAGDWVALAEYPDDYPHHYWLTSSDGDGIDYFTEGYNYGVDFAFCLGGEVAPLETPVSNWALLIGVILIGTFVIFRFRRMV